MIFAACPRGCVLGLERNLGYCEDRWRAVPFDTSHHVQKFIPPIGGGALRENLGSVCRQNSQTLSLENTFVAKNIPLNIHILPTITKPCTVSGENISFDRPIQI